MINIYSEKEIQKIKVACKIVAKAHEEIEKSLRIGITTEEIDQIAEKVFHENGANASCKGYPKGSSNPFPAASCISVNNVVIHGIPGKQKLKEGDLVCIDLVADKDGYFGDATRCYVIGQGDSVAHSLVKVARDSFYEGIKMARVGNRVSDISSAIQKYVEKNGFSVVREYEGHGIGRDMHESPGVPNFRKSRKGS